MNKQHFERIFADNSARFVEEWKEFLRFKSISTDPAYEEDCLLCASWVERHLQGLGFQTELIPTSGKPVVYAVINEGAKRPTVLYYGHYDVQPIDPIELWSSNPFEPELRDGRLYARGAQDNKGQTFYVLKAIESLQKEGKLDFPVKILLEGEEECSSPGITAALPTIRKKLKADILMVCDTGTVASQVASITMGLRGIAHFEARLSGIKRDLHSGVHGGLVKNPATEIARLVASLHDETGKVAVKGFYDNVKDIDPDDRALSNEFVISDDFYKGLIGVLPRGGESGFTASERRGFRPTVEVNGIFGGYQGQGSKTIIPSFAGVKISTRLVAGQDAKRILELVINHLKERAPKELTFEVTYSSVGGDALLLSSKSPVIQKAAPILQEIMGAKPIFLWEGASIPLVPALAEASGAEPLLVGFGLEEDNIHAPNESFALEQFKRGFLYVSMFLSQL